MITQNYDKMTGDKGKDKNAPLASILKCYNFYKVMNPDLENYVKMARAQGTPDPVIRESLLKAGWNLDDVNIAFGESAQGILNSASTASSSLKTGTASQNFDINIAVQPKSGKKKLLLSVIAVVVVALIGLGVWLVVSGKHSSVSTPSQQTQQSSSSNSVASQGWQTYKDGALMFEFGYPSNWNILISSTTNEEDITLSPAVINQTIIIPPSPALSVNYLVTDNRLHSEFFSPNPRGYQVEPIQIDRYNARFYVTTSTTASAQGTWFTETLGAYVQRGNRSGMTLSFTRYSTSSNFSISDDMTLFKAIVATVKFDNKVHGLTDAASENNDAQKYEVFSLGLANDLLFYHADHKAFPDGLAALASYNKQLTQPWEPTSTRAQGQLVTSLLSDFSYSVSPDHQSYHLGVSIQTTLVVDDGADSDFNSAVVGWINGFDGADTKPCRPSDAGIWCYDLVYSARGAAPLSATSSAAQSKPAPATTSTGMTTTCDSICITSPEDGSTISPGSALKITVAASPAESISGVTLMTKIGSGAILTKPPYIFSLSVPTDIQPGPYSITAIARDSSQAVIYSPQIIVNVGKP